jgi:hypothetical protein
MHAVAAAAEPSSHGDPSSLNVDAGCVGYIEFAPDLKRNVNDHVFLTTHVAGLADSLQDLMCGNAIPV